MYVAGVLIQPSKSAGDLIVVNRYERGNAFPVEVGIYSPDKIDDAIAYAENLAQQNNWIQLNEYNWQEVI